jgi:hypothetical protein
VYQALLKKGYSKGKAARIAQSQTGEALATGRPPKHAVKAANEPSEDLTTPSSQRVTPSPGNKVLQELRQANIKRQTGIQPVDPYAASFLRPSAARGDSFLLPPSAAPDTQKRLREAEQAELDRQ